MPVEGVTAGGWVVKPIRYVWRLVTAPAAIAALEREVAEIRDIKGWPKSCPLCGADLKCISAETKRSYMTDQPFSEERRYVCITAPTCSYQTARELSITDL